MKRKFLHVGKSSLSIILAVMMIMSTMLIGTITTVNAEHGDSGFNQFYLIGDEFGGWNTSKTYPIDVKYTSGTAGKYYKEYTFTNGKYFKLVDYDGNWFAYNGGDQNISANTGGYKLTQGDGGALKFTGTTGKYRICISQTGTDSNDSPYIWIEEIPSTTYSIVGTLVGDWSTYKEITTVDSSGVYSYNVTVTDTAKSYFRIANTNNTSNQFGPYTANYDITDNTSSSTAYGTTSDHGSRAFYFGSTGYYTIYVKDNNGTPSIWVTKTGDLAVTPCTVHYGSNDIMMGEVSAKTSTGTTVPSGTSVDSGTSVTFTATPEDGYEVEGWYSDAICTSKISGAGTDPTYTTTVIESRVVYVKFEEDTQIIEPVGDPPVLHKYDKRDGNGTIESTGASDLLNEEMTYHNDGTYEFYYYHISAGGQYLYNITLEDTTYYKGVSETTQYDNSVYINKSWSGFNNVFETGSNISSYYILYTPANTEDKRISVVTTLPDASKYTVKIEQGVSSNVVSAMGVSDLDETGATTIKNTFDDLKVRFRTKTTYVNNTTLNYTGYMYQVYGYSVLMTLQDGTKQVVGVMNPIDDPNSTRLITELADGVFMYDFTFPSNIKSAVVTPIFTVSADYAKAKGITFTKIYLKITPGHNDLNDQYEPHYYTWRSITDDSTVVVNGNNIERLPEGTYPGQKMVHSNDDMYVAYVQSDVYGLLFSDGRPGSGSWNQTFDYDEFRKLQKLGYNNITFEVMPAKSETIASTINNNIDGYGDTTKTLRNGSKTYFTVADDGTVSYTDTYTIDAEAKTDAEFALDVNIEGDYIDVFGNPLLDTNGNEINREAFVAANNLTTVSDELAKLLEVTGKSNKLYGARYGWYTTTNDDYGMEYAVRTYYIDGTNDNLISQQISGYGTIEGAVSPIDSSKTNAQNDGSLVYYEGNRTSSTAVNYTENTFSTGYELIPETYLGVPYLVSYKSPTTSVATNWDKGQSGATRIDGKWYYMSTTPQITVDAKVGLMDDSGEVIMSNGVIAENTGIGCTATVNGLDSSTIDQGTTATLGAIAGAGYKFVGFYQADGTFIFDANPHSMVFSSNTTVYAVFQPIGTGSLTVTNNVYRYTNPENGAGNGAVTVTLYVTPYDEETNEYGTEVAYSGTTSTSSVIEDGDLYRWEITGTPSGIDEFLTFRIAETTADGSIYYSALDDESCLSQSGTTYTYSSYKGEWNWYQQTGSADASYKTIDLFTDFSKTSIYAILNYKYKNRFGEVRTYTVKNVLLSEAEDYDPENPYTPTPSIILKYAPPIDEVFTSCEWKVTSTDLSNAEIGQSVATLTAVQTPKKFYTYVDNKEDLLPTSSYDYFNTLITISAPEVIVDEVTGERKTFSYWKRYLTNEKGEYDENAFDVFSYERTVGIRVSFNSLFEAVYGETKDPYTTNLQDAIYTREKYTDVKGNTADYVYADFLLQFETSNPNNTFADLVKDSYNIETNKYDIKFGIFTERDIAAPDFTGGDVDEAAPEKNTDLVANTIMGIAKDLGSGGSASTWSLADSTSDQYNYYYTAYDLTNRVEDLTILGRYDFYFRFTNNEINRSKVYNVYTYIIYTDEEDIEHIVISNGKTMCIYDTGIKEDGSAGITNTD